MERLDTAAIRSSLLQPSPYLAVGRENPKSAGFVIGVKSEKRRRKLPFALKNTMAENRNVRLPIMRDVSRGPRTACYGDEDCGARDGNREPQDKDCVPRDEACGAREGG